MRSRQTGSDSYPVLFQYLPKGDGLCTDEAPKILYIVAALENIAFEPDEPALPFARDSFGIVIVAPRNQPLNLAGQVFCEDEVSQVGCSMGQETPEEPLLGSCGWLCNHA